ncbi:hypothetical protein BS78_K248600 [Paspalum vaginatum]|uniref:Uncharacterized protein n=1 Tax=Paspalum vaginatum TaxID=158149 RepID=A0A9W7XEB7_9POAL|nr:hypothetical protein BS78_K248600 [Paspalum vaginatum]
MPAWADLVIGPAGSTSSPGGAAAGGTACRRGPANKTVVRRPRPPASPGGVCLEGSSRMETRCTVRQQGRANYQHEMQGYKKSMMSSKNMGPALFCRSHQACAHPGAPWCVQVARECPLLHGASRWYAYSRRNICYLSFRKDDKMSLQEFG